MVKLKQNRPTMLRANRRNRINQITLHKYLAASWQFITRMHLKAGPKRKKPGCLGANIAILSEQLCEPCRTADSTSTAFWSVTGPTTRIRGSSSRHPFFEKETWTMSGACSPISFDHNPRAWRSMSLSGRIWADLGKLQVGWSVLIIQTTNLVMAGPGTVEVWGRWVWATCPTVWRLCSCSKDPASSLSEWCSDLAGRITRSKLAPVP